MNKLYFDIETIPAPESAEKTLRYLYERKQKKHKERDGEEEFMTFEEFFEQTSFDGTYGRICTIAYALNNEPVQSFSGDETEMVRKFWEVAGRADLFVGHNIRDFDLPFIMQRSVILGVRPSWDKYLTLGVSKFRLPAGVKYLDFARYMNLPIFDTQWEWNNWREKWSNKTIEHISLALGIPTPKDGIDGSEVWKFYKEGKVKEICEYCMRDVETVRAVYKRMTFEDLPNTESAPF
ncbi:ribonuclease H-like domain-containing protein [Candidatus Parcubacteria bacterium]|nr:ribonuclease H-like domain-containing protein [Candidatus Parcubacteria bacterium]